MIHNETHGIMLSDQTQQPKGNKMDRLNNTTTQRKSKHLNYEKRIKIEALYKSGMKSEEIGRQIGCSGRTVRREIQKGLVELLNSDLTTRIEYSADVGEKKHIYAGTGKGPSGPGPLLCLDVCAAGGPRQDENPHDLLQPGDEGRPVFL